MFKKLHSGHWILLGASLFLVFIFLMLFEFMHQDLSMVTKDYYSQELKYNERQDAIQRTKPYDSLFVVNQLQDQIEVTIPEEINRTMDKASLQIYCAANESKDAIFSLKPTENNVYRIVHPQSNCNSLMRIELIAGEKQYFIELKI